MNNLLEKIKNRIEARTNLSDKYLKSGSSDNGFEVLVVEELTSLLSEPMNEFSFDSKLGHHFPDIDIYIDNRKYGLELKSRKNSWATNGNSVLETISEEDYDEIFLMFGNRVDGERSYTIRYSSYWKVLSDIKVTHSPRFTIDMNSSTNLVFKSEVEYNRIRISEEQNKVAFLQEYLRKKNTGKWYLPEEEGVLPNPINQVDTTLREKIICELYVLYVKDLLTYPANSRYRRCNEYMISNYFVYSNSTRDLFSAGGAVKLDGSEVPRVIDNLREMMPSIEILLDKTPQNVIEFIKSVWDTVEYNDSLSAFQNYKNYLTYISESCEFRELYSEKLSADFSLVDFVFQLR